MQLMQIQALNWIYGGLCNMSILDNEIVIFILYLMFDVLAVAALVLVVPYLLLTLTNKE